MRSKLSSSTRQFLTEKLETFRARTRQYCVVLQLARDENSKQGKHSLERSLWIFLSSSLFSFFFLASLTSINSPKYRRNNRRPDKVTLPMKIKELPGKFSNWVPFACYSDDRCVGVRKDLPQLKFAVNGAGSPAAGPQLKSKVDQATQTPENIARETRNFTLRALKLQLNVTPTTLNLR